jgi:hypothetical protein
MEVLPRWPWLRSRQVAKHAVPKGILGDGIRWRYPVGPDSDGGGETEWAF